MRRTIRRRLGFDGNPLRRGTDRVQTLARALVVVALLGGCVGGIVTGNASYGQQRAIEHLDATVGYRATGHVLSARTVGGGPDGPRSYVYRVAWQDPKGHRRVEGFGVTSLRALDGDTATVYVDARGNASLSPRLRGQSAAVAVVDGLTALVKVVIAPGVAYIAFLLLLDRRRKAAWAKEWAAVEPQWRRQVL